MGPETPLARGQVNVDDAIAQGLEVSGLQPPSTPAPDNPVNPDVQRPQRNDQFGFDNAHYLQNNVPDQRDFYPQGVDNVANYNFDTGLVPVARAGQTPMGVLANRQGELDRRKAQLDADRKAFDPYAGIDKASDQFQPAWGKIVRSSMDNVYKQIADARFGGDVNAVYDAQIKGDPEIGKAIHDAAYALNDVAQYNRGQVKTNGDILARIATGELAMPPPEDYQRMVAYQAGHDRNGNILPGKDPQELLKDWRDNNILTSKTEYVTKQLIPAAAKALQSITGTSQPSRDPTTGKILLTKIQKKTYDNYIDQEAQDWVDRDYAKNIPDAKEQLKRYFADAEEETTTAENPVPRPSGSGASKPKTVGTVDYINSGDILRQYQPGGKLATEGDKFDPTSGYSFTAKEEPYNAKVYNIQAAGGGDFAKPQSVRTGQRDANGTPITKTVIVTGIMAGPSGKPEYILAKSLEDINTSENKSITATANGENSADIGTNTSSYKYKDSIILPLKENEGLIDGLAPQGWRNEFQGNDQTSTKPSGGSKSTSISDVRSLVGKPGYEGYTEKELVDYYKSMGYTVTGS